MFFTDVVSGATQGAGSMKKWTLLSGMQFFMLFRDLASGAMQSVGSIQSAWSVHSPRIVAVSKIVSGQWWLV